MKTTIKTLEALNFNNGEGETVLRAHEVKEAHETHLASLQGLQGQDRQAKATTFYIFQKGEQVGQITFVGTNDDFRSFRENLPLEVANKKRIDQIERAKIRSLIRQGNFAEAKELAEESGAGYWHDGDEEHPPEFCKRSYPSWVRKQRQEAIAGTEAITGQRWIENPTTTFLI